MKIIVNVMWMLWTFVFLVIVFSSSSEAAMTEEADEDPSERKHFNFASHQAGAVILDKSVGPNGKGFNYLLNDDRDKYGISPCTDMKWIVISLSEEISITSIVLANFEKYSSMVQDFQLFGSVSYPTTEWSDLGTYTAALQQGEQTFNITSAKDAHIRYLKIKVLSHYEVESLCTLSQVKVYGITVFASLQQEVQRSRSDDLKHLLQEQESWQVADLVDEIDASKITEPELETVDPTTSSEQSSAADEAAVATDELLNNIVFEPDGERNALGVDTSIEPLPPKPVEVEDVIDSSISNEQPQVSEEAVTIDSTLVDVVSAGYVDDHAREVSPTTSAADTAEPQTTEAVVAPVHEYQSQRVALINEAGDSEEVQVNAFEWESFNQALKDINQTADSFVGIFKRFIDPISKTLDIRTLKKFIFSQSSTTDSQATAVSSVTDDHNNATTVDAESSAPPSSSNVKQTNDDKEESGGGPDLVSEHQQAAEEPNQEVVTPISETSTPAIVEKDPAIIVLDDMDKFKEFIVAVTPPPAASIDSTSNEKPVANVATSNAEHQGATEAAAVVPVEPQQQPPKPESQAKVESPQKAVVPEIPKHDVPDAQTQLSMNLTPPVNVSNTALNVSNAAINSSSSNGSHGKPVNKTTKLTVNCLEQLRFPEFQAKMIAKLQTNKNGTNGDDQIVNNKDNVFKQMMNRIKSLETNQLITEVYIAQTTDCFRVIKEQLIDGKRPNGQSNEGQPESSPDPSVTAGEGLLNLSINNLSLRSSGNGNGNGNATNKRAPGPNRQKNTSVMGLLSLTFSRLMFAKDEEEKLIALRYFVEFIRENAVDFWMTVCILLLSSVILFAMSVLMVCCVLMGKRKR